MSTDTRPTHFAGRRVSWRDVQPPQQLRGPGLAFLVFVAALAYGCSEQGLEGPTELEPSFVVTSAHCDHTVMQGESIQDAIDAASPGDTICVEAGTYAEALTVGKDIILLGAQAGVDARQRTPIDPLVESTITSPLQNALLITDGAAVMVDGFRFDNVLRFVLTEDVGAGSPGVDSGWGDLDLRNNIFTNAASVQGGYFWLRDDPGETFVFHQNYLTGSGLSNGLRIRAIQRSDPNAGLVSVDISDNLWEDNSGWAINVNNIKGDISGNVVRNMAITGDPVLDNQWGMLLATSDTDLTVEANEFENLTAPGVDLGFGFSGTLLATGNDFIDNATGFRVRPGQDIANVAVHFNNIVGNGTGVLNATVGQTLDATCNWWGSPTGPFHATDNPTGTGDPAAGDVDVDPWLLAPAPSRCPGDVTVVDPPNKVTGGGRIESADEPGTLDVVLELAEVLIQSGHGPASVGGKATFGLSVRSDSEGGAEGNLQFRDHDADVRIKAMEITSLVVIDDSPACPTIGKHAEFTGTADQNGTEVDFTVNVDDCGEPDSDFPDRFEITTTGGYMAQGPLVGGNIKIHNE